MTMDKEARKIAVYVAKFNGGLDYNSLEDYRQETYMGIGRDILKLIGFRKLPKDKPPLLRQEDCHQVDNPGDWNMGAEAQRDTDIRHYEGCEK